jgi:hypothetical protein
MVSEGQLCHSTLPSAPGSPCRQKLSGLGPSHRRRSDSLICRSGRHPGLVSYCLVYVTFVNCNTHIVRTNKSSCETCETCVCERPPLPEGILVREYSTTVPFTVPHTHTRTKIPPCGEHKCCKVTEIMVLLLLVVDCLWFCWCSQRNQSYLSRRDPRPP